MLWEDRENGADRFIAGDEPGKIIAMDSLRRLRDFASTHALIVAWEELGTLNLNRFCHEISALTPARKCTVDQCAILLNAWNFFDDFARTLDLEGAWFDSDGLSVVYKKLFHGNNLPAITPVGEVYNSVFDQLQIEMLRQAAHEAMAFFETLVWICRESRPDPA